MPYATFESPIQKLARQGLAYGDGNGKLVPLMDILRQRLRAKAAGGARQMFKMFKEMDRDASGTIDAKEFKQFLKHWNIDTSDKNVEAIIRANDSNGDGQLDYQEFVKQVLPEDYPEGKTARPGCRPNWLKPDQGFERQVQQKQHREEQCRRILRGLQEKVDLHPDRDKLVQRATAFFSDKTGASFSEFERIVASFGVALDTGALKLIFAGEAEGAGRMHATGHTTGFGRMPLFQLLTILLGRKRALDVWLARQTSGNGGVAHMMEFARIPLHNTEFHRQGLQANPAGHRDVPAHLLDAAESSIRAKIRLRCGHGQHKPFKIFREQMPVGAAPGQISLSAWKATVDMLGLEYPDNVLVGLFARYDTNQNGFIQVHELQKGLLPVFETQFPRLGAAQVEQMPSPQYTRRNHGSSAAQHARANRAHRIDLMKTGRHSVPVPKRGPYYPSAYLAPPPVQVKMGARSAPVNMTIIPHKEELPMGQWSKPEGPHKKFVPSGLRA